MSILSHSLLLHRAREPDVARRPAMVSPTHSRQLTLLKHACLAVLGISLALGSLAAIVALKTGATFWLHRF
jgi:hypothetical protein